MSEELTPWFDDLTRPFRVGWYDTKWLRENKPRRLYWDGCKWSTSQDGEARSLQCYFWRGLAKKP